MKGRPGAAPVSPRPESGLLNDAARYAPPTPAPGAAAVVQAFHTLVLTEAQARESRRRQAFMFAARPIDGSRASTRVVMSPSAHALAHAPREG